MPELRVGTSTATRVYLDVVGPCEAGATDVEIGSSRTRYAIIGRMVTDHLVANLLVAGVTKTGTTSLYAYLTQHPDICAPRGSKEIDFFTPMRWSGSPEGSVGDYGAYFVHCSAQRYRLDASPQYFDGGSELVTTVKEYSPDARILLMFRDPVERLWSHYRALSSKEKTSDSVTFREFLKRGIDVYEQAHGDFSRFSSYRAVSLGCYDSFARDWFEVFDDRVHVLFFEHLQHDARAVVERTCQWLGIDVRAPRAFDYVVKNRTVDPRSVTLSKVAYAANSRVGPALARLPRVKSTISAAYGAVNSRRAAAGMDPEDRRLAESFYRSANAALRDNLSVRGYADLPSWLASSQS